MRMRLEKLRDDKIQDDPDFAEQLILGDDLDDELLDEILDGEDEPEQEPQKAPPIDYKKLAHEIDELAQLENWARHCR